MQPDMLCLFDITERSALFGRETEEEWIKGKGTEKALCDSDRIGCRAQMDVVIKSNYVPS